MVSVKEAAIKISLGEANLEAFVNNKDEILREDKTLLSKIHMLSFLLETIWYLRTSDKKYIKDMKL